MNQQSRDAILAAVKRIPRGRVSSYGGVARMAGLPGRARLVGRVLRDSPDDPDLPWFRVLRANGAPAFAATEPQYQTQCECLRSEGIELVRGKVPRLYFGDDDDLDALLWGPP